MKSPKTPSPKALERAILALLSRRDGKTICPSEVARRFSPTGFAALMPAVRAAAARLERRGTVVASQRGTRVDPLEARGPIRLALVKRLPSAGNAYVGIDFRKHPDAYRVGRGERGVLTAEPYKSELLPLWRFRTQALARRSSIRLWNRFVRYRRQSDFVGMDMARKFLQMGFTRSRRYANHGSGRKYDADGAPRPRDANPDSEKAKAAQEFYLRWQRAERDPQYRRWRALQRGE